ncbi:hypothetical protein GRI97_15875 [Altererythrobacter xixiisoli]|uniref:Holin n=1 Tax=Croceibacterium xixiisoli TaxID=1476466 RepID=A0A6I4U0S5_9SPHN|nr:hypothetical protein [Croceibacterium xixiisoli]MXP00469.1 hypothetical protein [Croceibacterium xixiisoli]
MDIRDCAIVALDTAAGLLGSLTPSLIGSAVAQAFKPALPWGQRFLQWLVGSAVSYYATTAIVAITDWEGFVPQSIAFAIALLAFDATPRVARAAIDTLASLPPRIADRFLPPKKD